MSGYSFPAAARLQGKKDYDRVYRRGFRLWIHPLGVQVLPKDGGKSRLGLSVSKKVGGSVARNRWKRAIREAFRLQRHRLEVPCDLVVMVDWDADEEESDKVEEAFREIIEELNERLGGRQK